MASGGATTVVPLRPADEPSVEELGVTGKGEGEELPRVGLGDEAGEGEGEGEEPKAGFGEVDGGGTGVVAALN